MYIPSFEGLLENSANCHKGSLVRHDLFRPRKQEGQFADGRVKREHLWRAELPKQVRNNWSSFDLKIFRW